MTFVQGNFIMPTITIPIPDTKDSVTRPIMTDICHELFERLDMSPDTEIYHLDESGVFRQRGSSISDKDNQVDFGNHERIIVEVSEEYVEDDTMLQPTWQVEYPPIFRDDALNVLLKPVYRTCILNINFKKQFKDRTQAIKWRDTMAYKVHDYDDMVHHLLTYHYLIPKEVLFILKEVHRLRELNAGYGDTFQEWFKTNSTVRLALLANLSGEQQQLGVKEKQSRVYGTFDFETAPEKGDRVNETESWVINFEYKVHFSRITHLTLIYPQVIHQTPLAYPYVYDDTQHPSNIPDYPDRVYSLSGFLLHSLASTHRGIPVNGRDGFAIPSDDEFRPPDTLRGTRRLVTMQVLFDPEDGGQKDVAIVNLTDIPDLELDPEVQKFLSIERKYMNQPHESVLQLTLYNQHSMLYAQSTYVDEELNVRASIPIKLRNNYHLRFSVYHDWSQLSSRATKRLQENPRAMERLLDHLEIPYEKKDKYTDLDMEKIIRSTTDLDIDNDKRTFTVETLYVVSYRHGQNPEIKNLPSFRNDPASVNPSNYPDQQRVTG